MFYHHVNVLNFSKKQELLVEQLHNENLKMSWSQNSVELIKVFDTVASYQQKLTGIKRDMKGLHERSLKLKVYMINL